MPLKFGQPPTASVTGLADDLPRYSEAAGGAAAMQIESARLSAAADRSTDLFPHEVFALELDDVRAGLGVSAARPTAWRYLIGAGSALPQAADVRTEPGGGYKVEAVRSGSTPIATLRAVQQLQADPRVQNGSYEIRMLLFPAARLRSLWLAADTQAPTPGHERDLFYPLNNPQLPTQDAPNMLLDYRGMSEWLVQLAASVDTKYPETRG